MTKYNTASLFESEQPEQPATHVIRVAFDSGVDSVFDYLVPDKLWPLKTGQRVEAPFGKSNKLEIGFCVETDAIPAATRKKFKLKIISEIIDKEPLIDNGLMELAKWISDYYVCPLGVVLAAMPLGLRGGPGSGWPRPRLRTGLRRRRRA